MPPKAAPALPAKALGKFEGRKVDAVGLEIRNAAGGLNDAMKIDPVEMHIDEEVTVVMRCTVTKVRHDPLRDTDGLRRVHILTAGEATIVDDELVAGLLDAQKIRIEKALGTQRLPIELVEAHLNGDHADGLVEDCPNCAEEQAALDKEARAKK